MLYPNDIVCSGTKREKKLVVKIEEEKRNGNGRGNCKEGRQIDTNKTKGGYEGKTRSDQWKGGVG